MKYNIEFGEQLYRIEFGIDQYYQVEPTGDFMFKIEIANTPDSLLNEDESTLLNEDGTAITNE